MGCVSPASAPAVNASTRSGSVSPTGSILVTSGSPSSSVPRAQKAATATRPALSRACCRSEHDPATQRDQHRFEHVERADLATPALASAVCAATANMAITSGADPRVARQRRQARRGGRGPLGGEPPDARCRSETVGASPEIVRDAHPRAVETSPGRNGPHAAFDHGGSRDNVVAFAPIALDLAPSQGATRAEPAAMVASTGMTSPGSTTISSPA